MYITVLNFEDGRVYQHNVGAHEHASEDYEAFLDREGYELSNIEWMVHKNSEIISENPLEKLPGFMGTEKG
jgi:hypothetical protein